MYKAIIFGGTTEGRVLYEYAVGLAIPVLYCARTDYIRGKDIHTGALDGSAMTELIIKHKPELLIDATHPYAVIAHKNIRMAANNTGVRLIRVVRQSSVLPDNAFSGDLSEIISRLNEKSGNIFAAAGSSAALALCELTDWRARVWLRILPQLYALRHCLKIGYDPWHIICMQGPFSVELNKAMFIRANAEFLITKEGGAAGGFDEKIKAAEELDMEIMIIAKPIEEGGVTLDEAKGVLTR